MLLSIAPLGTNFSEILINIQNKLQWNFHQNTKIFIHENAVENIYCQISPVILSRGEEIIDIDIMAISWEINAPMVPPWPAALFFLCVDQPVQLDVLLSYNPSWWSYAKHLLCKHNIFPATPPPTKAAHSGYQHAAGQDCDICAGKINIWNAYDAQVLIFEEWMVSRNSQKGKRYRKIYIYIDR